MNIEIIGNVDRNRLYCTASFTKFLTTYVCLSFLMEKFDLSDILDDDDFFDKICTHQDAKTFLKIFQKTIGSRFSIRDVCSFYNGLPYTFDLSDDELEEADHGKPLKHHCVMDEKIFLSKCKNLITQIDPNRCKFHYSELAIIFFGYIIEKVYDIQIEVLYQKYVLDAFSLKHSLFSRTTPPHVYRQDLSDKYDYPSVAINDHGFFSYSNGFFTTLEDQKKLLEGLIPTTVFAYMTDINKARAASTTIMNGLTVEIRLVNDDIIYGYEGLSYSGCNIWAYSTKLKKGYLTTIDSEEDAYDVIYGKLGYHEFDKAPLHTQKNYQDFISHCHYVYEEKTIPDSYIGQYQRVNINEKKLQIIFTVDKDFIVIRNPDKVKYEIVYENGNYRTKCKDNMHGIKVSFHQAKSGNRYMFFDGVLYKKLV